MDNNQRVLMIGLDGATFDLVRPWVEEGHLPNLARLMGEGAWAPLRSTHPPMTFPAWNAFMTGMNPGKHGIYDFTERRPGSYEVQFVNARQRQVPTLWMRLSQAGKRVGVMGVPCTWPPEPVNGVMISGFDAPRADASAMYPESLHQELLDNVGPYRITSNIIRDIDGGRPEAALDSILKTVEVKGATARYLYGREPWDCFMVLFGESDVVSHHFWRYMDPESPHYEETDAPRVRNAIRHVYEALDEQVGALVSMAPEGTTVLIASDHGFGGTGAHALYVNRWLAEKGLLAFRRKGWKDLKLALFNLAKVWGSRILPTAVRRKLRYKANQGVAGKVESALRFGDIDWSRTRAYCEELAYYPPVWVNLRGREPEGIVPEEEYEQVRDEIIRALGDWTNPTTGEPIVDWARRREEVYNGPRTERAADVVVNYALDRGYTYLCRPSRQSSGASVERLDPHASTVSRFLSNRSGSHRKDGILIMGGDHARPAGEATPGDIIDVTPTVLYLLGLEVAEEMDGRVLEEMLDPALLSRRPVRRGAGGEDDDKETGDTDPGYTEEEEAQIRDRLEQWGYL